MGITHMALFAQYSERDVSWVVVEPSVFLRIAGRLLFTGKDVKFSKSLPNNLTSDFALVASPVKFHRENFLALNRSANKVFIEKPLSIPANEIESRTNVLPGYVLRHNSMIAEIKRQIEKDGLEQLSVSLRANTASPGATGWRFSQGQGVIEEFGSHVLNLALFLAPGEGVLLRSDEKSTVTKVPDVFEATIQFGDVSVTVSADWADSSARKPLYTIQAKLKNGHIVRTDMYELEILDDASQVVSSTSVAHEGAHCSYYLRGFEFSEQAKYFFENEDFAADLRDAIRTDQLIVEIANGSNSRG